MRSNSRQAGERRLGGREPPVAALCVVSLAAPFHACRPYRLFFFGARPAQRCVPTNRQGIETTLGCRRPSRPSTRAATNGWMHCPPTHARTAQRRNTTHTRARARNTTHTRIHPWATGHVPVVPWPAGSLAETRLGVHGAPHAIPARKPRTTHRLVSKSPARPSCLSDGYEFFACFCFSVTHCPWPASQSCICPRPSRPGPQSCQFSPTSRETPQCTPALPVLFPWKEGRPAGHERASDRRTTAAVG